MSIKVLIVEDHELTRKGIIYGLSKFEGLEIVAEAENGKEAIDSCDKTPIDLVLMDIALPVMNGIKATQVIKSKYPHIKVIMLTSYSDKDKLFASFEAGADSYCLKDIKLSKLHQIIQIIIDGGIWLDPQIAEMVINMFIFISKQAASQDEEKKASSAFDLTELTTREKEILTLISKGLSNKEISESLSISVYTVKNHVSNLISKLSVNDRTQAAILALKEGII